MRAVIIVALCLLTLPGCRKLSLPKQPPRKITIAYTTQPDCALVQIAVGKGFFAEEGLQVEPQLHSYGKAALSSLLEGKADLATAAETPIMFAALAGAKLRIVAGIASTSKNNAIFARKDLGISRPEELKGKRIGYTPGTTGEFFLESFLTANGIPRQDAVPVPLQPDEMAAALGAGRVAAVSCWNFPLTRLRRALGERGVAFFDPQIYTQTFNLVARQESVAKNPGAIGSALRALVKAEGFAREHPGEARALVAAALNVDPDLLGEVWDCFAYQVELDRRLIITLEDQTRWAMKNRLAGAQEMPDYGGLVYPDALAAVKPDAVTINR